MTNDLKRQMQNPKEPVFSDIAETISQDIENIWVKASLPIVSHTRVIQMIKTYHLKCKNILKSIARLTAEKKQDILMQSKVLFDISSCKCKNIKQCTFLKDKKVPKSEQAFLIDQQQRE